MKHQHLQDPAIFGNDRHQDKLIPFSINNNEHSIAIEIGENSFEKVYNLLIT